MAEEYPRRMRDDEDRPSVPAAGPPRPRQAASVAVEDEPDWHGRITHIQIIRAGFMLGGRITAKGDVYPVIQKDADGILRAPLAADGNPSLMPPVVTGPIDNDRAILLIQQRRAIKHHGPPRLVEDDSERPIENASLRAAIDASKAVGKPQKGAM